MLGQTSLTSDNRSLALQVEVDEAAVSPEVESGRHARFQWTGLGFAGLMLIGLSAYVLLPAAPHAPEGPWPLDAAFSPTLPMVSPANLKQAVQPLSPPVFKQGDIFQLPKRDLAHQPTSVTAQRNGAARVPGGQAPAAGQPPAMRQPQAPRQSVPAFPRDENAVEDPSLFAALKNLIPNFNPLSEQQLYRRGDFLKNDENLEAKIAGQMQMQNLKARQQDNRPAFSQPELPGLMPGFWQSGALDTDRSAAQQAADARAAQLTKESTSERIARKRQEAKEKAFGTVGMTTDDIRTARQGSGGRIGSNRAAMPDYTKDQFGFPIDETGFVETGGARDRLGYVGSIGQTEFQKQQNKPTPSAAGRLGSLFGRGSASPSTPRAQSMANARAANPAANARGNLRQSTVDRTKFVPVPPQKRDVTPVQVRQAVQPAGGRIGSVGSDGYVEDGGAMDRLFGFLGRSGSSGKPAAEPQVVRQASAGIQTATVGRLGSLRQASQTATVGRLGSQRQANAAAQPVPRPAATPRGTQRVGSSMPMASAPAQDDFQLNEQSLKAMFADGEDADSGYVEESSVFDKLGGVFGRVR